MLDVAPGRREYGMSPLLVNDDLVPWGIGVLVVAPECDHSSGANFRHECAIYEIQDRWADVCGGDEVF